MKAIFFDFYHEHPKCGKDIVTNIDAQALFDLLSTDENIIAMIDASEAGKPAIAAVVQAVESYCDNNRQADFDLTIDQRRTVVGCMIKTILSPFGYIPVEPTTRTQKELPKSVGAKYFKSGSCYFYDSYAPPTMKIVRTATVEELDTFSLKRIVKCPYCNTKNRVDLEDGCTATTEERPMGTGRLFEVDYEEGCTSCAKSFRISGYVSEYPVGALEYEKIKATPTEE